MDYAATWQLYHSYSLCLKNCIEQWYPWVGLQRLQRRILGLQLQVFMEQAYNTCVDAVQQTVDALQVQH